MEGGPADGEVGPRSEGLASPHIPDPVLPWMEPRPVRPPLLDSLTQLHRFDDLEPLLDFVTDTIVAHSSWETALLTFYFGGEPVFGASGCPEGTKERFQVSTREASPDKRIKKRQEILRYRRPGTNICFMPAGEGPQPAAAYRPSEGATGTWQADDRLIIMLWDWNDDILGVLSLDLPKDGDRPDEEDYRELAEIDRYVNLVAKIAENRFWSLRLEEREQAYRGICDAATDAFVVMDPDGTIVEVNPAACRLHGYDRDELLGRSGRDLVHPESHPVFEDFLRETSAGRTVHLEARSLCKDGTVLDTEVRGASYQHRGRQRMLAVLQDVTEKKLVFQRVLDQQKDESIVAVAGGVAHDFNNLLMGITGSLDLLRHETSDSPEALRHCDRIDDSARKLAELTDQLRAIARGVHSHPQPVSLTEIVEESRSLLEGLVGTKFRLVVKLTDEDSTVPGDRVQLRQLLLNLCQNACEAMGRSGTVTISTEPVDKTSSWSGDRTGTHDAGAYVRLRVQDDGAGMDEETKRRLFEPYYSTKPEGSGLGLAATLGIIRRHQGAITVHSEPDVGTTIDVLLPRVENIATSATPVRNGNGDRRHVLLVDDKDIVREVGCEMLRALDCEATAVESGEEALEVYRQREAGFDLVILDVSMPGMSGIETHAELRKFDPDVLVVLSSGHTEGLVRNEMVESATIAAFLQKPYHLETLRTLLDGVFNGSHRP